MQGLLNFSALMLDIIKNITHFLPYCTKYSMFSKLTGVQRYTDCNSCILYFYTIIWLNVIISHIICICADKLDEFLMHIKYTNECKPYLHWCQSPGLHPTNTHVWHRAQERTSIKGRWFKIPVKITDQILSLKIQTWEKLYKQQKVIKSNRGRFNGIKDQNLLHCALQKLHMMYVDYQ